MKTPPRTRLACGALVLLCSAQPLLADYSNTVGSLGPLGYWRLNETSASPPLNTLSNSGSVGSAGTAVVVRQVAKGQPGAVGNSIRLTNGTTGNISCDAKVDVPHTAALNPSAPFSVEFWAKPVRNDQTLAAISSINCLWNGGASRMGWLVYQDAARWQFRLGGLSGYLFTTTCSTPANSVVLNDWQHVVATYDGAQAKIYLNGDLKATVNSTWTTPNTSIPIMIGALPLSGGGANTVDGPAIAAQGLAGYRGFDGNLDEVAIYPTALSAATITAHYAARSTPATYPATILGDSPLGYWNCDEPAVTPPDPSTFPIATNSGSVGSALNGTNFWGALAAQDGAAAAGFGAGNKACFFDGDSGYVALGDDPAMHFSGNITMMAWVKPSTKNYFRNIIGRGWAGDYSETFLRLSQGDDSTGNSDGRMFYEVGRSDGSQTNYNDSVARFEIPDGDLGNWVFVAGTYDGANWNLYRNGVLVGSKATPLGAIDVTNRWSIGARSEPSPTVGFGNATFESEGLFFHGAIDEPAIFNTALSAGDITSIYNSAQAPPVITRAVVNPGTVFKGSSASFSVWGDGAPALSYLWLTNGISTGVTATNFTASNLQVGTPTIAVAVSNPYGSVTSSVTFAVIAAPPTITTQPVPVARYVGRPFTFSVTASGSTPLSYQWRTNGVPISGATGTSYGGTASAATAGDYTCTVSNETSIVVTSSVATLTVVTPPTATGGAMITDLPVAYWRLGEISGTVAYDYYNGQNGTYFGIGVGTTLGQDGYSALDADKAVSFNGANSYIGNINGDPATGGINFSGHTNFTLEAWVNAASGQAEQASIVAKGIGSVNTTSSEQFVLDVGSNPETGQQAFRFFTRGNNNAAFPVYADIGPDGNWHHVVGVYDDLNALGLGALKMHIFVDGELRGTADARAAGLRISSSVVSIGSKRLGNDPAYDGTINGIVDEVAIYPYALTGNQISNHYALAYGTSTKPTITRQPTSLTVYESSPTPPKFDVGAYGTQPLTYQWKKQGVGDLTDDGHFYGTTTRALTIDPVVPGDAGTYFVTINNDVGPATNSANATLTVLPAPTNVVNVPGLVLHMTFDDTLNDTSGRANHGTGRRANSVIGSFTNNTAASPSGGNPDFNYVADGKLGKGLHYRTATTTGAFGAVTNAHYVTLGERPDLHFGSDVSFSVAYWVRFPAFNGEGDLGDLPFFCSATNSYGNAGYTFAPSYELGSWSYSFNGVVQVYGLDYLLDDGVWHHLAHSVDRAGNVVSYVDGKQRDVRSAAAIGDLDTGSPVTNIGQDPTGLYPEEGYYDIDDLGVWRRALTAQEIVGIYLAATEANSSFVDILGIPTIAPGPGANQVTITYQAGTLQSSTNVAGPYVDVPGATSPHTTTATGSKYFRTRL